mmetsp:Transcript_10845/g.16474  ORF Transcript_10845/g.16474 Transcript_10845/m.16474 type:complete len:103 (-) Transcript_10845:303-611(-)
MSFERFAIDGHERAKKFIDKVKKTMDSNGELVEKWQRALDDLILIQKDDKLFNGNLNSKKIKPYKPVEVIKRTQTSGNELQSLLEQALAQQAQQSLLKALSQ